MEAARWNWHRPKQRHPHQDHGERDGNDDGPFFSCKTRSESLDAAKPAVAKPRDEPRQAWQRSQNEKNEKTEAEMEVQ
jgi:hypothetical protein